MLTIEEILAAKEPRVEEVPVPEWGGSVFVRKLTALEAVEFHGQLREIKGNATEIARLRLVRAIAGFLCDESGNTISTLEQAEQLAHKSATVVNRIVMRGYKMNAMDDDKDGERAKNSEPSRDDSSPSV